MGLLFKMNIIESWGESIMKGIFRKILYFFIGLVTLGLVIVIFRHKIGEFLGFYYDAKDMEAFIKSFGSFGPIIFVAFQVLQVIIFFIPGEFMQAVGGYLFDTLLGTILSIIGILIGSAITFIVARKFGDRFLKKILPKKDYTNIKKLICKPKNRLVIFILYLLPGFPKDVLGYVSGITSIKLKDFIIISSIARLPGILITSYLGSNIYEENYLTAIYILIGVALLLIIGIVKRNKVINFFK